MGFGKTGNSPYKWRNRGVFLGHAQGVFIPRDCLVSKAPYTLMHVKNERNTCNHHANSKITESMIFIYNKGKEIPLTYLLHLHCACISINIISGLACVISKVQITFYGHIYWWFQLFLAVLLSHSGFSKIRLASGNHLPYTTILQFVQSKNGMLQERPSLL